MDECHHCHDYRDCASWNTESVQADKERLERQEVGVLYLCLKDTWCKQFLVYSMWTRHWGSLFNSVPLLFTQRILKCHNQCNCSQRWKDQSHINLYSSGKDHRAAKCLAKCVHNSSRLPCTLYPALYRLITSTFQQESIVAVVACAQQKHQPLKIYVGYSIICDSTMGSPVGGVGGIVPGPRSASISPWSLW